MSDIGLAIPRFIEPDADNLFLASRNGLKTYGELASFKDYFLQYLLDSGHDLQKPVGFLAHSSDELIFALAACWMLGVPFVCFSPNATARELNQQLEELQPNLVFTDKDHKDLNSTGHQVDLSELDLDNVLSREVKPDKRIVNFTPDLDPERVFGYFFTSGTTSTPKIVPLKRRQMYFAAEASAGNFRPDINHFWLLCLPLNHIGGISIVLRSILYGSGIYRMNRFDVDMVSTFLSENTMFQVASLVPTMLKRLLDIPAFRVHKSFQAILVGGGPVTPDLIQESLNCGIPLVPSYGMTETCAQIAANPVLKPSGRYTPLKSTGMIFPPNEIQIRDIEGRKVGANTSGAIWLRGPQVFDGYYSPENNNDSFDEDGWFNTGDFGHMNANGQLFIETRRTDLIITGGENVSPFEVESELEKIDPITEAAVLGLPHEEWGQEVVAVVVARTKQEIKAEEIVNNLKERITSYKIPKKIVQAPALPRTESGKVKRSELRKFFE